MLTCLSTDIHTGSQVKPTITVLIQCYCAGFSIASVHYGSVVQLAASVECHVLDCHVAVAAASCELTNCPTIPAASRPRDEGWQHAGWSARSMGQAAGERRGTQTTSMSSEQE